MRRRVQLRSAIVLVISDAWRSGALADVRTEQKTHATFGGPLGRMIGMFGGKAAKEGIVETVAVKGDRKMTTNEKTRAALSDLAEAEGLRRSTSTGRATRSPPSPRSARRCRRISGKGEGTDGEDAGEEGREAIRAAEEDGHRRLDEGDRPEEDDQRLRLQGSDHHDRDARGRQDARGGRRHGHDQRLLGDRS